MLIKFLDTSLDYNLINNYGIKSNNNNIKEISSFNDSFVIQKMPIVKTETEELQEKVLSSLNYVSNNGLLPSSLPDTLNIKFISNSLWDKLKVSLYGDPIAQLKIPNIIFISPQLLPHNIKDNDFNITRLNGEKNDSIGA